MQVESLILILNSENMNCISYGQSPSSRNKISCAHIRMRHTCQLNIIDYLNLQTHRQYQSGSNVNSLLHIQKVTQIVNVHIVRLLGLNSPPDKS